MANTSYFDLYKALKADGAVQGDWNSFHKFVGAQGKQGYLNRKKLYDALKADGAVQASTYEEFNNNLFRGGQASLKAARQRNQQPNSRTQAHARNNNGTASQQPQTAAQRALQMVQQPSAPKGKVSPFVQALYSEDNARRSSVERPYTMPTGKKEDSSFVQNMKQRDQRQKQFMRGAASVDGQLADYERQQNAPIVDNGTVGVMKTQGQLEDELNASADKMVAGSGDYINDLLEKSLGEADAAAEKTMQRYLGGGSNREETPWYERLYGGSGQSAMAMRAYNTQISPEAVQKRVMSAMDNTIEGLVSDPKFLQDGMNEAERIGVSPQDYIEGFLKPRLASKLEEGLRAKQLDKFLPRNALQMALNKYINSNTVMKIATLGTSTRSQRQLNEEAMAMTDEGKNPHYKPGIGGTIAGVAGDVAGMVSDPIFKASASLGGKATGAILGNGTSIASKIANGSVMQKLGYMAGSSAVGGGVTGFTFGFAGGLVNNLSTGEDTSLGNTLKMALSNATGEAGSFAVMGVAGAPLGVIGQGIGSKTMKDAFTKEWWKAAVPKVGLTAAKTYTEAFGMNLGGYVSQKIQGNDAEFYFWNGNLESLPTAIGFRLTHLRGGQKYKDDKGNDLKWYQNALFNLSKFAMSDKAKSANMVFTEDEKQQLFGSGSIHGLMPNGENIVDFARRASKNVKGESPARYADVESDTEVMSTYYNRIINDPNVSWDAKAKFTTMVMGVIPGARPMHDHYGFSIEDINGKKGKYISSFAKDGTLLSKKRYDNPDQRGAIIYEIAARNEDAKLRNAFAIAVGSATDQHDMQAKFLSGMGYFKASINEQLQMLADMGDKSSKIYRDFLNWCVTSEDSPVTKAINKVSEMTGMKVESIWNAFDKDPMKRSDVEQNVSVIFRKALTNEVFPESKPHPEQSLEDGKDVVTDNNLGTDQPNGEAVVTEWRNLKQAEAEMEQSLNDKDIFSDNFKNLQQQGLTHPQIYDWMIQNGMKEEQLLPYAKYMNQVAKVQGMQDATAKAIEENVGAFVQDWSFHGTMDGKKMNGEQALWVRDNTGRTLLVGSGDVSYDPTNGKPKDGVGDMLVCLDPNTGETVYIKVEDTTLFQNTSAADLEAYRRQQLQQVNSAPYNQAAQEQAMADAANPQPKQEEKPAEQPQQGNVEIPQQDYTLSEKKAGNGEQFYQDESGNIDLANIPDEVFDSIGYTKAPFRLTPSMIRHMLDRHNKELKFKDENEAIHFVRDVMTNFDHVRLGADGALVLSIENGRNRTGKRAITILINSDNGQFYGLKTSGYEGIKGLERRPLLWERGANKESSSTDAASVIVPTSKSSISGEQSGSASNQSIGLGGKDTNNSLNNNEVNTTLTFKDGTPVPVDANGEPDFMNMTPEQGAELYNASFNDPDAQVAKDVKAAEKVLKDAKKMEPNGKTFNEKKKSQQVINETIKKAEEQLRVVKDIQKTMTAKKVAETIGKPEGESVQNTEGMDEATKNFVEAPKVEGRKGTITLPNGEEISGTYYAVPAMSLIPSHDPFDGYKPHAGVPLDENGHTINDRDYYNDKSAQDTTNAAGNDYDGRAISDVPVVNPDGRVLSGNGRTMAGQIAAANGKDAKYAESRDKNAEGFGMKAEDLNKLDHARIIFVPDEPLPYTTETFAKFNRNEKKTQSNTEQAVAKAKSLSADEVGAIVADIEGNGSLEAFFNNPNAINSLIKTLQEKGIIGQNDVAELMEGTDKLSPQGKEMVKNLLLGSIFKPETIRMLGVDSAIKNKAVAGIRAVMDNLKLGDYSLRDEIDQAIQLLYEARTGGNKVDTLLRTPEMFKDSAAERYPSISQMMALALEGKASDFRDLLNEYNHEASARNTGEGNVFGDTPTKEELIRDFLNYKEWKDYETRGNSETERGNDAEGVRKTEPEAQGGNDGGKPESKPSGEPAKPEDGVKAEEAKKDTTKSGENIPPTAEKHTTSEEKDTTSTTNPVKSIEDAAASYRQEKIDKAAEAYKAAKESGDEEATTKAAKTLKHLMDENLKGQGYSLKKRQALIGMIVGKKEAEIIDKPFEEMDLEEREFTASKNPLTESEINELTSEENKDLIPAALDYLHGNTDNVVGLISYLKIWNDVRNRHENAADNSGAKDGTQLAPSDNGSGEGLGLGTGRDSGGPAGQVDRGTGNEPSSGERESGESGKNDPTLPAGEQGNKQGEGDSSRVGDVSSGSAEPNGGSGTGKDGNVSKRGGRKGSGGSASKNAERKPTAKQGTHFPNSTAEQLKKEREEYEQKKKDFWDRWKKAGQGYVKIALTPFKKLNLSPKQIEMLPELIKMHLHGGFLKIKEGMFKFNEWKKAMLDEEGKELKMIGMSDDDIDRFIDDYWNTPYEMDGEKHTLGQWSSIYGSQKLREKLAAPLAEKYKRQMDAEPIKVKVGDRKNIEETLPYLLPQQQEDVYKAETQFFRKEHADREHAYGKGYMFTNGTGTGKTYTGLGIAKRLVKQGKGRILFVTPSGQKVKDWIDDGKNLGLDIRDLNDWAKERGTNATTESGEGCVITTFANFGSNKKLLETEWDAVIYDESHRIMENKNGKETARSMQHYKVTNRDESHCFLRLQDINPHYQKMQAAAEKFAKQHEVERKKIIKEYKQEHPSARTEDVINATYKMMPRDINTFAPADAQTFPKLGKLYNDFKEAQAYYYNEVKPKLEKQAKDTWKNTKTIFLSATPFNTRENLDYAEGYIFKYPKDDGSKMSGRTRFYLDHFGAAYKFRYNRLEQSISNPEAVAKQEVAFSDYLQNNLGTMSGRIIDSPYDYSRDFPTVAPDHADAFNNAVQECLHTRHLYSAYLKTIGDYNYGSALFETMKVANSINRIKEHLAAGRKVVIYHRRVESKEPIRPPFEYMLDVANRMISQMTPGKEKDEFIAEANEFREKHQDLLQWEQTLDYSMPREQIAKVFGKDNVLFFSGKETDKVKKAAIKAFNEDNSGKNILVIQEASGKEGISLQDKTGEHQRVVITLALPQSPITALQIEGRIYRIGNMSNAIFEYPILGLNSEMMLFGQKFNNQVSTTENLALGSQARNLRDSFAKGILEHSGIIPIDQQGVGGKAFDAPKQEGDSDPFDDAVLDYYSNQKLNKNNREGIDYFPTPEPLGYKMVQWAGLGEGDSVLEPSAGHGAIARYVPQSNELMSIEPSQNLFSRLQLKVGGFGRKFLNNIFENYDIHNKHDAVIMNPPFGKAGATAIQHLDKAFKHLDEGGRVVALIPRGATDKKFEAWLSQNKDAVLRAEVNLPDITFQQAGTSVMSRVVVFDKVSSLSMREKAGSPEKIDLSGHYDKVEDFFEDLRDIEMPDRIIDTNFKMQKKSRQAAKDIKDIKGVRKVELDKHGIVVKIIGDYNQYGMVFTGSENAKFFKNNMASYYKMYDKMGQKVGYDDTQKAVFDEFKKLSCKLAGMTEEEMQRYIKSGGSDGATHFREDRGIQYSKTDEKDVKNSRIIPEDVDKNVSSQIEKKFDDEISSVYGGELAPEERNEVERIANLYRNTPIHDEYSKDENGNKRNHGGLESAIKTWERLATDFENYYGIKRITRAKADGQGDGLNRGASGLRSEGRIDGMGRRTGDIPEEDFREYQSYLTNLASAKRALEYHNERTRVLEEKYGVKRDEWLSQDTIEKIFKDFNSDKNLQTLFDRIKGQVKNLDVYFGEVYGSEKGLKGFYRHSYNDIRINLDSLSAFGKSKQDLASTILHEMLHPVTSDIIAMYQEGHTDKLTSSQIEAAKDAVDLFNEIKNTFKEKGWEEPYALTNAREFFTELSSPEWRAALKKIKNGDSWWKRAIKSIAKMLGFKTSTNKLDEAEKVLYNLLSNFGKEQFDYASRHANELFKDVQSKKVEDKDELDRLNKEKTFRMYSGMQELDGKLYSPMAAIIDGKRTDATEIGSWMAADERPDLVKNGKFTLVKTDKAKGAGEGDVPAAYNPYMHTSTSMMNDQFTGAYARGNIKVVEWEIPESEKTSGYRAEGAKDAVGMVPWHSGSVNSLLPKDRQRSVMLSRWRKAVRVVPDSEVAESIAQQLKGTGLAIPWNVVTPNQLRELAKIGVPITTVESGKQSPEVKAKFEAQMEDLKKEFPQSKFVDVKMTKDAFKEWGKNGGTHFREDRSSEDLYNSLKDKRNNRKEYNGTVTELANRVKQGTARIVREGKENGPLRSITDSIPAIAGKILASSDSQGIGSDRGVVEQSRVANNAQRSEKENPHQIVLKRLVDWAKDNNCRFNEEDVEKSSLDGKVWNDDGLEATIYRAKDGNHVIKVMPIFTGYENPTSHYLDRNKYFNEVFPDTSIEVIGYGEDKHGETSIIYKQPLVEGETVFEHFNHDSAKSYEYIDKYMEGLGYKPTTIERDGFEFEAYTNGKYNLFDVNNKNVIIDKNGKPHVIDAEVLPVDYKEDGKIEIKDSESTHFRAEDAVRIADDAPVVVKHVDKIAKKVGGKVKMVQSVGEITNKAAKEAIEAGKNITGWYDEKTGEVHLYMPNIHDRYTAEKTIWHEVVGHKGMRKLIGDENYSKFLRGLWYDLDKPENARLKELVSEELKYNPFDFENGIEEGIARLVEDGKGAQGFWNNIKNKVTDLLHEVGYRVAPNTKDVKYLLWLAKNVQKHPDDLVWKMRAEAVRYKLSKEDTPAVMDYDGYIVNNYGKKYNSLFDLGRRNFEEATDGRVHFRTSLTAASKIDEYNRRLGTKLYAFKESTVDDMQAVQEFMEVTSGEKNVWENIPSSMNPLQAHNRIGAVIEQKADFYNRNYIEPLDDVFKKAVSLMDGEDGLKQKRNFELYAIQKHGLERNREFFVRDSVRKMMGDDSQKQDAGAILNDWYKEKDDLSKLLDNGSIRLDQYFDQMDEWIRNNVDAGFVADEHDCSGFHAIQKIDEASNPYNDKLAIDTVMGVEDKLGDKLTRDFWNKKKAATDWILENEYEVGKTDKTERDHLKNMFNWYVPLRKFDDATAEDVYGYITDASDTSNFIGSVIASANGRISLSDTNVFAQIGAMANASLITGGNNIVKQHLARFVSNYEKGDKADRIFLEINPWMEKHTVDGNEVWEEATPQIPENATQKQISDILQNFENEMQAKKDKGEAELIKRNGSTGYRFVRAKNKSQHLVEVYIAGKKKTFFCQANPRAAQAINGLLKDSGTRTKVTEWSAKINRQCAQLNTSYNPDFMMSNLMRDLTAASANLVTKEGIGYTYDFMKEYKNNFFSFAHGSKDGNYWTMFGKYRNGKLDMNNEKERMFKEFMENGGQTGFVQIQKLEELTKAYENFIKTGNKDVNGWLMRQLKSKGGFIEAANEIIENMARYSTYCVSRKHGRSVGLSIYNAKEVSTNFNRHGSGDAIKTLKTANDSGVDVKFRITMGWFNSYMRNHTMFYNAGVQGANLFFKNYKASSLAMVTSFGALPFGLNIALTLINQWRINNEDEKERKGVKDPYAELPEWKRRNNLCIYTGKGRFLTIPIAIELRAFYGLGDIAMGLVNPKLKSDTPIGYDILGQMAQLVPASDFLGHHTASDNTVAAAKDLGLAVTPTLLKPEAELIANRDWTGRPIYRDKDYLDKAPQWKSSYDSTNDVYMTINKWANMGTNGVDSSNPDMKGNDFLDRITAPYTMQHMIDGYFGGLGATMGRATKSAFAFGKSIKEGVEDKEGFDKGFSEEWDKLDKNQIPFWRVFNYTPSEGNDMQRTKSKWYNYSEELEQLDYNMKQMKTDSPDMVQNIKNAAKKYKFYDTPEGKQLRTYEFAKDYIRKKRSLLKKVSDPEVIKAINEDIDRKMQEAVNDLDKLN